jgi:hypothetical protein
MFNFIEKSTSYAVVWSSVTTTEAEGTPSMEKTMGRWLLIRSTNKIIKLLKGNMNRIKTMQINLIVEFE